MKPFMDENFLLTTETAQKLFHEYVKLLINNSRRISDENLAIF